MPKIKNSHSVAVKNYLQIISSIRFDSFLEEDEKLSSHVFSLKKKFKIFFCIVGVQFVKKCNGDELK